MTHDRGPIETCKRIRFANRATNAPRDIPVFLSLAMEPRQLQVPCPHFCCVSLQHPIPLLPQVASVVRPPPPSQGRKKAAGQRGEHQKKAEMAKKGRGETGGEGWTVRPKPITETRGPSNPGRWWEGHPDDPTSCGTGEQSKKRLTAQALRCRRAVGGQGAVSPFLFWKTPYLVVCLAPASRH